MSTTGIFQTLLDFVAPEAAASIISKNSFSASEFQELIDLAENVESWTLVEREEKYCRLKMGSSSFVNPASAPVILSGNPKAEHYLKVKANLEIIHESDGRVSVSAGERIIFGLPKECEAFRVALSARLAPLAEALES